MTRKTGKWLAVVSVVCLTCAFAAAGEPIARDVIAPVEAVAQAVETAPAPAPTAEARLLDVESECADVSTPSGSSAIEIVATPAASESTTQAAPCKPCKGRTWCTCTYNGMRRVSCDPCCYVDYRGVETCFD